jgi:hypothetical protein
MHGRLMADGESDNGATDVERSGLGEILRRRRWMWAWFFGSIPVGIVSKWVLGEHAPWIVWTWMTCWAAIAVWHEAAPCPRCGYLFSWGRLGPNAWKQHCGHCGLPLRLSPVVPGSGRRSDQASQPAERVDDEA